MFQDLDLLPQPARALTGRAEIPKLIGITHAMQAELSKSEQSTLSKQQPSSHELTATAYRGEAFEFLDTMSVAADGSNAERNSATALLHTQSTLFVTQTEAVESFRTGNNPKRLAVMHCEAITGIP